MNCPVCGKDEVCEPICRYTCAVVMCGMCRTTMEIITKNNKLDKYNSYQEWQYLKYAIAMKAYLEKLEKEDD